MTRMRLIAVLFGTLLLSAAAIAQDKEESSQGVNGLYLKVDSLKQSGLYNKHGYLVEFTGNIEFNVDQAMQQLKESSMGNADLQLVLRIVTMMGDDKKKRKELWNVAKSFSEVREILIIESEEELERKLGARKLKKLKKRKR